ncbi:MAG: nucleotidyltransferase domain-containing protein [Chloroflexaceae bacterium]|nr:nucleotidyltransferase domain-containing protein [Chloroflexaceae bacterium]
MRNPSDFSVLPDIFRRYPDIQAVYVFGSVATGTAHAESDLDLAIVPATRGEGGTVRDHHLDILDILTDLARHGFCHVDLVFLDTQDMVLRYEAVRHNILVYQREDFDRGSYYSLVVRQYFDFLPYLKVQREALKRRMMDGQHRGSEKAPEQTQ